MKKAYLLERPAENTDSSKYIDWADLAENRGVNICGGRNFQSYFSEAYKDAENVFEDFNYYFESFYNSCIRYFLTHKNMRKKNGVDFSPQEMRRIKELFENGTSFEDIAAEVLSITQGEKYKKGYFRGCSQGDCVTVIYPEKYTGSLEYAEACYFNTGDEYAIREAEDAEEVTPENFCDGDVYFGYFTEFDADEIKKRVSQEVGTSPEFVTIFRIKNSYTKYNYTTV